MSASAPTAAQRLAHGMRQNALQVGDRSNDPGHQVILQLERRFRAERAIVGLGPEVGAGGRVDELDRDAGDEPGQAHRFLDGELGFALQSRPQGLALEVGHHVIEESARRAGVEQRQQVGVLEIGGDLDLGKKALGA